MIRSVTGPVSFPFGVKYPWTSFFILRGLAGRKHKGIDISAKCGKPVKAPTSMRQTFAGWRYGYGNTVEAVSLDGRYWFRFAHLKAIGYKRKGKEWKEGEVFAWVGTSGFSTGCHLHFETKIGKILVDPLNVLKNANADRVASLTSKVNKAFRFVFNRDPSRAENDYYRDRITGKRKTIIVDYSDLTNKMMFWKSRDKTKGL